MIGGTRLVPRLRMNGVVKSFDGGQVLNEISLELLAGETRALLGENGSGKSTLVKILSGVYEMDSGELLMDGRPLDQSTMRKRVTVIHQDLGLAPQMSVFDNIAIGVGFGTSPLLPIPSHSMRKRITEVLKSIRAELDLDVQVDALTASERTVVAVARAILRLGDLGIANALFILDEPTAVATAEQAAILMKLMRDMAMAGAAVLFITHRIAEAMIADRVTVLRDGDIVLDAQSEAINELRVIDAMLGRRLEAYYPDKLPSPRETGIVLSSQGLRGEVLDGIDIYVRAGEILGVTGIGGMGQDEVPQLLCHAVTPRSGTVVALGKTVTSYSEALSIGMAYLPANRRRDGGWIAGTAQENIALPVIGSLTRWGMILAKRERVLTSRVLARTRVRPPDPEKMFGSFSGGNQQKIVIGKWLQLKPRVLLLHEPTQGVDVGARRDLLQLVNEAAQSGTAVVIASNDFEQLAELCHRVIVLYAGRVLDELRGNEVSEANIAKAAQHLSHK